MTIKVETNTVKTVRLIAKTIQQVENTEIFFFHSKLVAYVLDGSTGEICSVDLQGGKLVAEGSKLRYINRFGLPVTLIDTTSGFVHEQLLYPCEGLRGEKNPFPYVTLNLLGRKVNVYSKHILGVAKFGNKVFRINGAGNTTIAVVWKDKEAEDVNAFDNLELNWDLNTSDFVDVGDNRVVI